MDRAERVGGAGDVFGAADRDQHGHLDPCGLLPRHQLARAAQAHGERAMVGAGLIGKRAKGATDGIGDVVE